MLNIEELLFGYNNGIFPMADSQTKEVYWYSPDPRAIIPLESYKPSKSLRPLLNRNYFEVKVNTNYKKVISSCSLPRFEGDETWISNEIEKVYFQLHKLGFSHSVETYLNNKLVGGLYGVAIGGVFFGESMFHNVPNASKVAFHYLIEILKSRGYKLLDTQFINDNVKRFGAIEIPKSEFLKLLHSSLLLKNVSFPSDISYLFEK